MSQLVVTLSLSVFGWYELVCVLSHCFSFSFCISGTVLRPAPYYYHVGLSFLSLSVFSFLFDDVSVCVCVCTLLWFYSFPPAFWFRAACHSSSAPTPPSPRKLPSCGDGVLAGPRRRSHRETLYLVEQNRKRQRAERGTASGKERITSTHKHTRRFTHILFPTLTLADIDTRAEALSCLLLRVFAHCCFFFVVVCLFASVCVSLFMFVRTSAPAVFFFCVLSCSFWLYTHSVEVLE